MTIPLTHVLPVSEEEVQELAERILQKDYTSEALSFIKNHSRTLHYWAEGDENLLPAESLGHHRFSFLDLVWLGIVQELRDLGLSKRTIYQLKTRLLATINANVIWEKLLHNQKEMEDYLVQTGAPRKDAKAFVDAVLKKKDEMLQHQQTVLLNHVYSVVLHKRSVYLLINKEGAYETLMAEEFKRGDFYDENFHAFYNAPHVSLHLNSIVGFFLSKDYIQDHLKEKLFTPEEWKIIATLRSEKPETLTIKFSQEGKVETIKVTRAKKVQLEARLSEIIGAGAYETITIVTQNGKPVSCTKQINIK